MVRVANGSASSFAVIGAIDAALTEWSSQPGNDRNLEKTISTCLVWKQSSQNRSIPLAGPQKAQVPERVLSTCSLTW